MATHRMRHPKVIFTFTPDSKFQIFFPWSRWNGLHFLVHCHEAYNWYYGEVILEISHIHFISRNNWSDISRNNTNECDINLTFIKCNKYLLFCNYDYLVMFDNFSLCILIFYSSVIFMISLHSKLITLLGNMTWQIRRTIFLNEIQREENTICGRFTKQQYVAVSKLHASRSRSQR